MYCPRCETPVAKAEIAQDKSYKDVTEKTATVKFKLDKSDDFILAWTTTPWTLPGNTGVMVHPKFTYVKLVLSNGEKWIIAKELKNPNTGKSLGVSGYLRALVENDLKRRGYKF